MDAFLDREEARILEEEGLDSFLGDLGKSITSGKVVGTAAAGAWGKAGLQLVDDDEAPRVTSLEVEEEEGGCGVSRSGGQVGAAEEEEEVVARLLAGQQIHRGRKRRSSCRSLNVPAALARGKSCVGLQMLLATLRRVRRCSVYLLYAY